MKKNPKHPLSDRTYPFWLSQLFTSWYRGPNHPSKLRILSFIQNLFGRKRIIASTKNEYSFFFAVDNHDWFQQHILYKGVYEAELTHFLEKTLCSEDVFLDIGANIGYYSCLSFACSVDYTIAFEPDPISFLVLQKNIKINKVDPKKFLPLNIALSNKKETLTFYQSSAFNSGMSGFIKTDDLNVKTSIVLNLLTLDEVFADYKINKLPTVIKIDVEGFEYNVLLGAKNTIEQSKPHTIIFEEFVDTNRADSNFYDIKNFLEPFGYNITTLELNTEQPRRNYLARQR